MIDLNDEARYWLGLIGVRGIGPIGIRDLLAKFKTPGSIFSASESDLMSVEGLGRKIARAISAGPDTRFCDKQLTACRNRGYKLISLQCPEYPERLKQVYDPPTVLFVNGDTPPSGAAAVAVVGSRIASHYGKTMAERISDGLASSGITVVSGLARGIDSVAHRAAIGAGGKTVAVVGCGLDITYPPENASLYRDVSGNGAVISELPCGAPPEAVNFPRRNRIISGVCLGVIVVEAGRKSGALLTAQHALDQNREVFAVPGNATSTTSAGTNELIRAGAHLATSAEDVLQHLELMIRTPVGSAMKSEVKLSASQVEIFSKMGDEPVHIDNLARITSVAVPTLLGELLEMEIRGAVLQMSGKRFVKLDVNAYNG